MILFALAEGAIQLVPDGTLIFHLAVIIAMVAVLNATLLKPINRILEERERRTKGRMSEAEATLQMVSEKARDYEQRLRAARAEGYALMERERLAATAEREQQVSGVRTEVSRLLSEEREKIGAEALSVRQQLKNDARNRALEISRQILDRPVAMNR